MNKQLEEAKNITLIHICDIGTHYFKSFLNDTLYKRIFYEKIARYFAKMSTL